ncbi:hypothetical protein Tco_0391715, partial [Tanacetum coccineum]
TAEPRTLPTTTTTAFKDEDLTIAQTLVKMKSQKDKEKGNGVAFRAAQEESARLICTNNTKITRKWSKPNKHGHGNEKSAKEPKDCYQWST